MAKLYEYAILHHPQERGNDAPDPPKLLVDVQRVLVKSERDAVILASRQVPEEYTDRLEEVEIVVRPF